MLHRLKKRLYFVVAGYFGFWAKMVLRRWRPRLFIITGSSGKTTLLHMVEAQIGQAAVYSHHANSAVGIPIHILGLPPNVPSKSAWLSYVLKAPFCSLRRLPKQKIYVVEADCDRPHEGAFTSKLLKPEAVMWVSLSRTHSMNFDKLVKTGRFVDHEQAIAYEFGNFIAAARKLVMVNADYQAIEDQLNRVREGVQVKKASILAVDDYKLKLDSTNFKVDGQSLSLPGIHPKGAATSLQMVLWLLEYLGMPLDLSFTKFDMPSGRNNVLKGKRGTVLIDSTYNTGLGATVVMLDLFNHYPADHKWLVIGDILEQGSLESEEHERLAKEIAKAKVDQVVLLGKRTKAYSLPVLQKEAPRLPVVAFERAGEVLDYLTANLKGGEAILFKGAQGLEGVIEQLLMHSADSAKLVRRGPQWTKRRREWGLPK